MLFEMLFNSLPFRVGLLSIEQAVVALRCNFSRICAWLDIWRGVLAYDRASPKCLVLAP